MKLIHGEAVVGLRKNIMQLISNLLSLTLLRNQLPDDSTGKIIIVLTCIQTICQSAFESVFSYKQLMYKPRVKQKNIKKCFNVSSFKKKKKKRGHWKVLPIANNYKNAQ